MENQAQKPAPSKPAHQPTEECAKGCSHCGIVTLAELSRTERG